jgi:hypothetical protein
MRTRTHTSSAQWRRFRIALAPAAIALVAVLLTGMLSDRSSSGTVSTTFTNHDAEVLLERADTFSKLWPDRRAGTRQSRDAANWLRDEFRRSGATADVIPSSTTIGGKETGILNVEATIPGRSRDAIVITAHRDNLGSDKNGGDPVGTVSLLRVADDLAGTRDRRYTTILVSTDARWGNSAGAALLAERLQERSGHVVAIVDLAREPRQAGPLADSVGGRRPPVGLVTIARAAAEDEVRPTDVPGIGMQLASLALPVTTLEHGPLLSDALPAVTLNSVSGDRSATAATVGDDLRILQRTLRSIDQLDAVDSAGKTWVETERRILRGWALKVFVAAMLLAPWLIGLELLLAQRRAWTTATAVGSVCRAALGGGWIAVALWFAEHTISVTSAPGTVWWILVASVGVLIARAPDWRRAHRAPVPQSIDATVALLLLCVIAVGLLAINPFAVLLIAPAIYALTAIAGRVACGRQALVALSAACAVPFALVAAFARTNLGSLRELFSLMGSGGMQPLVTVLLFMASGVVMFVFAALLGRVHMPLLPRLRTHARTSTDLDFATLRGMAIRRRPAALRRRTARNRGRRAIPDGLESR